VAASVAANILHAQPHLVSQLIAGWPPVALLLTVELISRVPVHRRTLAVARLAATTAIAGIAAWVSYWHMVAVAARHGETGLSAYLLPVSVDGLIIVASVSLVELSGRLRAAQAQPAPTVGPSPRPAPPTRPPTVGQDAAVRGDTADPPATPAPMSSAPLDPRTTRAGDDAPTGRPESSPSHGPTRQDETVGQDRSPDAAGPDTDTIPRPSQTTVRRRRRGTTRTAVIDAYLQNPTLHPTAIAELVGTSERSVRRYLDELRAGGRPDSSPSTRGASRSQRRSPLMR
jgi:hypothetical protein